jgi:hypothetical protein
MPRGELDLPSQALRPRAGPIDEGAEGALVIDRVRASTGELIFDA